MDIEKLKQKILDLAIRGKLVPQDPDDEPASVLIDKFRAEKEKLIKEGKIKRDKNESYIYKGSDNCYYEKIGNEIKKITNELSFNIPDNWQWVRLKNLGEVIGGGTPATNNIEYWDGNIIWITPAYMSKLKEKYITTSDRKITEKGLNKSSARMMPPGSIVMSSRAPIGYLGISKEYMCTSQGCKSIIPFIPNVEEYIYLVLSGLVAHIRELGSGTTFKEISIKKFADLIIPLPPLNELKLIVDKVNYVIPILEKLNTEESSLNNLIHLTKNKILDYYFGENSCYKSYYGNRTLTTLKKLIPENKIGDGDWVLSEDMDEKGEYALVQLKHIGSGIYNLNKSYNHINKEFYETNGCSVISTNYILINRLIASNMSVCLLPNLGFKAITSVDVCWIAPDDAYIQEYIMYYLLSPSFQQDVSVRCSGSTRKRISKKNLISIPINIHNIKEQILIVNRIKELFKILDSIIS